MRPKAKARDVFQRTRHDPRRLPESSGCLRSAFLGEGLEVLTDLLHLLTQLLDLATQLLDAAFKLRHRCGGVDRTPVFWLTVSLRCRRSLAAGESLGVSGQRIRLVIQSGGPEVFDGGAEMLQPALSFFAFRSARRAIAGTLLQHPHQFMSLTS